MTYLRSGDLSAFRRLLTIWFVISPVCLPFQAQQLPPTAPDQRVPVLVELFTSEGCSDCPPADALLAKLDASQPVRGVEAIVLSEHVTYWNHLGWRDPFSFQEMTDRQEQYGRQFGLDSSYTPQMVVDGETQFVGGNAAALVTAVTTAAKSRKQPLTIEDAKWVDGGVEFALHADAAKGSKIEAALAIDATHQEVSAGENAGRTLHHVAVVRVIKEFGSDATDGRKLKLSSGHLGKTESAGPVRLVVFRIDSKSGHVLGVAEQTLNR